MSTNLRYTGTKIKPILKAQGRYSRWLSQQVGIHESEMSRIVNGKSLIRADVAERVAAILGVPFFVLFDSPDGSKNGTTEQDRSAA